MKAIAGVVLRWASEHFSPVDCLVQQRVEVEHWCFRPGCVAAYPVGRLLQPLLHGFTQGDVLHLHAAHTMGGMND